MLTWSKFRNKVFVFSGIIPICQTEDGLAAVLGHEIAHNVAHHVQEKASMPYLFTLIVGLVTLFFDNSEQLSQLVLSYALELPNSRAQEARIHAYDHWPWLKCWNRQRPIISDYVRLDREANVHSSGHSNIRTVLMARSCYNPEAAVQLCSSPSNPFISLDTG